MGKRGNTLKTRLALYGAIASLCLPSTLLASGINKKVSDVCRTNKSAAFRAKYCSAAKDYKAAYTASLSASAVWGGVTTVCGLACGKAGPGGLTCKIASMGGTVGEGVLTKKFTDALKGEAMQYGKQAVTKDGKSEAATTTTTAEGATTASESKVNGDACMVAGTSAMKGYEKLSNSKQSEKSIGQLREQTKGMNNAPDSNAVFSAAGTNGPGATGDDSLSSSAMTSNTEVCGDNALNTAKGAIRCAASADPTLPAFVQTEEFLKDIQKATGKTAEAFFDEYENPGKSLMEAPGMASLSGEQKSGVAESLSMMDRYSEMKVAGKGVTAPESYKSAGGTVKTSEGEDGFDVNGVIANMLGQMNGEEAEKPAVDGVNTLAIGANRMPAGIISPEDRTISIFSRVEWRYRAVITRDHLGVEK